MANMLDYLDWRGDIDFSVDPFNEVDNLILAELAYTDFKGIVPGPSVTEKVSLKYACDTFFANHTEEEIMASLSSTKVAPFLMKKMVESKRFRNMKLGGYVNEIDVSSQTQFSAITFFLEDGTIFVAYRGTDNTVVGWKEDFNMSFLSHTEGQIRAVKYLDDNFRRARRPIRVGGHSKGGNFAVFASAFCVPEIQNKIIKVYSNDGPGFLPEILEGEGYQRILQKIQSTIPESSIVGLLLENEMEHGIVKSSASGAKEHDLMSWEVLGNRFVYTQSLAEGSVRLDQTLKTWIYGLEPELRAEFVDILFSAVEDMGVSTLDELAENKMKFFGHITRYLMGLAPDRQKALSEVFSKLAYTMGNVYTANWFKSGKAAGEAKEEMPGDETIAEGKNFFENMLESLERNRNSEKK